MLETSNLLSLHFKVLQVLKIMYKQPHL